LAALLARVEQELAALEDQQVADDENGPPTLPPELRAATALRARVQAALAQVRAPGGPTKVNLSDPDAPLVKTRQGITPGYNAQAVVSAVPGPPGQPGARLIVATTLTTAANDCQQLAPMLTQATALTGQRAGLTVADAGYYSVAAVATCADLGATVVVPEPARSAPAATGRLPRHAFTYHADGDYYTCPGGQELTYRTTTLDPGNRPVRRYRGRAATCAACPLRAACTRDTTHGRTLKVPVAEDDVRRHRTWMATDPARMASRQRKSLIEPVFGLLKERLGGRRFLRRGLAAVQSEWHLLAAAVNLRTLVRWWQRTLEVDPTGVPNGS
jgi:hypothetical protein